MTTRSNDIVVIELGHGGLVRVCAWCTPRARLEQLHREHRCTDTICASCSAEMKRAGA